MNESINNIDLRLMYMKERGRNASVKRQSATGLLLTSRHEDGPPCRRDGQVLQPSRDPTAAERWVDISKE
jgi:hypothetical protein